MLGTPEAEFISNWLFVMRKSGISTPQVCIETGTYQGKGTLSLAELFPHVHTIELSDKWFEFSSKKLAHLKNVICHHGDSAEVLEQIVPGLNEPAVFFLDAHFAGGDTAFGQDEVPLLRELKSVSQRPYCDLIIIDDLRLIGKTGTSGSVGNPAYPLMTYNWTDVTMDRIAEIIDHANRTHWAREEDRVIIFRNLSLVHLFRLKIMGGFHKLWILLRNTKRRFLGGRQVLGGLKQVATPKD
jgi:hypothetical protein